MRSAVFFDASAPLGRNSRFWMLLVLAAVIAAAGVVGDSTATVIGAMIVAPLMTPIQGIMLATVLGDRANLIRSLVLVLAGAAAAVAIAYLVGVLVVNDVLADTNSQVAARVTPGLIDLLAALGTGVVGSVALIRRDISDALPGVAIAISLVPPLSVVGLTLESGSVQQSLGALLLFMTNVVAIIGTGIIVMSFYGVNRLTRSSTDNASRVARLRGPIVLIAIMVIIVGAPLTWTSVTVAARSIVEREVFSVADTWSQSVGWRVSSVSSVGSRVAVRLEGPSPVPDTKQLGDEFRSAGLDTAVVDVTMIPVLVANLGP
jgi:uncharacterized hydrophobic protein (TIGR00271 family)